MPDLETIRQQIDSVDDSLLKLLEKRADLAVKAKELKSNGLIYKPSRESEIIRRLIKRNNSALPNNAVESIYREIISACRNLQRPLMAAFLGPEGTYSHEAALKLFGNTAKLLPQLSLAEAIRSVENGSADVALLPVENSSEGAVIETHRLLLKTDLYICSEFVLPISHCLISKSKKLSSIKAVHAHPQAMGQCREWLQLNLPDAELINESSNGKAVINIKKKAKHAAIASSQAASIYNMPVLRPGISDLPGNQTRFIVLGHSPAELSGEDKTSIICSVNDKVGALHELLSILAMYNVNLVRLESQPHTDHEYVFYMDMEGHQSESDINMALKKLSLAAKTCKILGSYAKAK
jgi:chorismate mutase / prephenate dehydratase